MTYDDWKTREPQDSRDYEYPEEDYQSYEERQIEDCEYLAVYREDQDRLWLEEDPSSIPF